MPVERAGGSGAGGAVQDATMCDPCVGYKDQQIKREISINYRISACSYKF
jgi:hypothetical protein